MSSLRIPSWNAWSLVGLVSLALAGCGSGGAGPAADVPAGDADEAVAPDPAPRDPGPAADAPDAAEVADPGPVDPGPGDPGPGDPGQPDGSDDRDAPDVPLPGLPHGSACADHAECRGGFCAGPGEHPFFEGGYCTALCDPDWPDCGDGAACFDLRDAGVPGGLCVRRCEVDGDCRPPRYVCAGSCIPAGFRADVPPAGVLSGTEPDVVAALAALDAARVMRRVRILSGAEAWNAPGGPVTIRSRHRSHPDHEVAIRYLESELEAAGLVPIRRVLSLWGDTVLDLVADLPGTDPEADPVLVGAHYDSIGSGTYGWDGATDAAPGASDNATGVAVALEIASVLARPGAAARPVPVRILLLDGEEDGLIGSRAWLDAGLDAGACFLNVDMVGASPEAMGGRFWFQFDPGLDDTFPSLAWEAVERFVPTAHPVATGFTDTGGSDSEPFWDEGRCSVALISWPRQGTNHTVDDTVAGVDPAFLETVARSALAAVSAWSR